MTSPSERTDSRRIACIGWGSLVWDPRELPRLGEWRDDGPLLPVEFARESGDEPEKRRITLVICENAPRVPTCWSLLDVEDMAAARHALALREHGEPTPSWTRKNIGFCDLVAGTNAGREAETIAAWAANAGLAGVVWTDLPCGFRQSRRVMPDADAVIAYLRNLNGAALQGAEEYVRKAPAQVDTAYRRRIVEALGWSYRR